MRKRLPSFLFQFKMVPCSIVGDRAGILIFDPSTAIRKSTKMKYCYFNACAHCTGKLKLDKKKLDEAKRENK